MAWTVPIAPYLNHRVDSITPAIGYNEAADTVFGSPIIDIPCQFDGVIKEIVYNNGNIVKSDGLFFFGPEIGELQHKSKIVYDEKEYEVLATETYKGDLSSVHHYEVWVRRGI